jgi:hypothetical protein
VVRSIWADEVEDDDCDFTFTSQLLWEKDEGEENGDCDDESRNEEGEEGEDNRD